MQHQTPKRAIVFHPSTQKQLAPLRTTAIQSKKNPGKQYKSLQRAKFQLYEGSSEADELSFELGDSRIRADFRNAID